MDGKKSDICCGSCQWHLENPERVDSRGIDKPPKIRVGTHVGELGFWRCMNPACKRYEQPTHHTASFRNCKWYEKRNPEKWVSNIYDETNNFRMKKSELKKQSKADLLQMAFQKERDRQKQQLIDRELRGEFYVGHGAGRPRKVRVPENNLYTNETNPKT